MPVLHITIDDRVLPLYKDRVAIHNAENGENSGFDILVADDVTLTSASLPKLLDSGIQAEMIEDDGSSGGYYLTARSSICKVPIRQHNAIGVIDPGYRGSIKIPVTSTTDRPVSISKGARYFQLVHPSLRPFKVKIVAQLSDTHLLETHHLSGCLCGRLLSRGDVIRDTLKIHYDPKVNQMATNSISVSWKDCTIVMPSCILRETDIGFTVRPHVNENEDNE